jgi:hypothetical protein
LAKRARRSSGPVKIRALAWPFVWVRSPAALRPPAIGARIASAAPSRPFGAPRARPDCAARAARAALTASSGPGLALPTAVLPTGAGRFYDPDAGRSDVPGRARAVASGPLDAGQGDGPEPAQPAEQAGVSARGGGELVHAKEPAGRVKRCGDTHAGVGDPRRR